MSNRPRPDRITERREEAALRNNEWAGLTNEQKLERLNLRLGVGVGAKRQRQKLTS